VRLSFNGEFIHQICDPGDEKGRITGVVRAAVEELWNDLKRASWVTESSSRPQQIERGPAPWTRSAACRLDTEAKSYYLV
jgi:hypothetical protein